MFIRDRHNLVKGYDYQFPDDSSLRDAEWEKRRDAEWVTLLKPYLAISPAAATECETTPVFVAHAYNPEAWAIYSQTIDESYRLSDSRWKLAQNARALMDETMERRVHNQCSSQFELCVAQAAEH